MAARREVVVKTCRDCGEIKTKEHFSQARGNGDGLHTRCRDCLAVYKTKGTNMSADDRQVGGSHYKKHEITPWMIVDEYNLSFYAGSALKYQLRKKGDIIKKLEDLDKAIHCLEKEKEIIEKRGYF